MSQNSTREGEEVIDTLNQLDEEVEGRIPGPVDWSNREGTPCDEMEVVEIHGGEWDKALLSAGIITEEEYENFSRLGTLQVLEDVVSTVMAIIREEERERNPTLYEVVDFTGTPASEFIERFGSWSNTLNAVSPGKENPECRSIPRDELLREIERVTMKLERPPTRDELEEVGGYSLTPYRNQFGSVKEAREAAQVGHPSGVSRTEFVEEINRIANETGKTPETTTFNDLGQYSHQTCYNWFESWDDAVAAAGCDPLRPPDPTKEDLLGELRRLADDVDGIPKVADIRAEGEYRYERYLKEFGGISEARKAAGIEN